MCTLLCVNLRTMWMLRSHRPMKNPRGTSHVAVYNTIRSCGTLTPPRHHLGMIHRVDARPVCTMTTSLDCMSRSLGASDRCYVDSFCHAGIARILHIMDLLPSYQRRALSSWCLPTHTRCPARKGTCEIQLVLAPLRQHPALNHPPLAPHSIVAKR